MYKTIELHKNYFGIICGDIVYKYISQIRPKLSSCIFKCKYILYNNIFQENCFKTLCKSDSYRSFNEF